MADFQAQLEEIRELRRARHRAHTPRAPPSPPRRGVHTLRDFEKREEDEEAEEKPRSCMLHVLGGKNKPSRRVRISKPPKRKRIEVPREVRDFIEREGLSTRFESSLARSGVTAPPAESSSESRSARSRTPPPRNAVREWFDRNAPRQDGGAQARSTTLQWHDMLASLKRPIEGHFPRDVAPYDTVDVFGHPIHRVLCRRRDGSGEIIGFLERDLYALLGYRRVEEMRCERPLQVEECSLDERVFESLRRSGALGRTRAQVHAATEDVRLTPLSLTLAYMALRRFHVITLRAEPTVSGARTLHSERERP